jgi:hypothetical protein
MYYAFLYGSVCTVMLLRDNVFLDGPVFTWQVPVISLGECVKQNPSVTKCVHDCTQAPTQSSRYKTISALFFVHPVCAKATFLGECPLEAIHAYVNTWGRHVYLTKM